MGSSADMLVPVNLVKSYLNFVHIGFIHQILFYVNSSSDSLAQGLSFERRLMELDLYILTHTFFKEFVFTKYISGLVTW